MPQSTMARASLALVLGTLLAFAGYLAWSQLRSAPPGVVVTQVAGSGQALVGGSFELTDQYGATRRESEFRGQFMLVYFGYSNCPDVCPIALSAMSDALDELAVAVSAFEPGGGKPWQVSAMFGAMPDPAHGARQQRSRQPTPAQVPVPALRVGQRPPFAP